MVETNTTHLEIIARDVPEGDFRLQIGDVRCGIEKRLKTQGTRLKEKRKAFCQLSVVCCEKSIEYGA